MDNIRTQLSLLITLANSDGEFHERERAIIDRVARTNHVTNEELEGLIQNPAPLEGLEKLSYDDKFDYLYNVILLMKADSVVQDSELLFCQRIANSLGFQLAAFMELYPHVHPNLKAPEDMRTLKKKLLSYLVE